MVSVRLQSLIKYLKLNVIYYFIVYLVVPTVFIFQMSVVYPNLVVKLEAGIAKQCMHICIISFFFVNVIGNMILSVLMDSRLTRPAVGGTYCEHCQMLRPVGSWHCMKCNVCILKRDHHCTFLARCVGLNNRRYFILFLGHIMLSMMYMSYYNYYFATLNYKLKFDWRGTKSLPGLNMFLAYSFLNVFLVIFSSIMFFCHLRHAVWGVTYYESRFPELRKSSEWKQNLLYIFGTEWYLAIVWPFCNSPTPKYKKNS